MGLLNLHTLDAMGIDSFAAYDIALNNYDFDRIVAGVITTNIVLVHGAWAG
jgi:hypothetical protein